MQLINMLISFLAVWGSLTPCRGFRDRDGKAKLLREDYCDGLGDCLPACPTNAISFEEREAPAYNEAAVLGYKDEAIHKFLYKALFAIGMDDWGMEELLPIVLEVGEVNLKCMAMLDKANTDTFGHPEPTTVNLTVKKGPFIVISGHDLYDLKRLLEQTEGKGINIYTHGEMLPAFVSPNVLNFLVEKFNIAPITTPEEDLKAIWGTCVSL